MKCDVDASNGGVVNLAGITFAGCVYRGMCHNVKVSTIPNGKFIFCNSITSGFCVRLTHAIRGE